MQNAENIDKHFVPAVKQKKGEMGKLAETQGMIWKQMGITTSAYPWMQLQPQKQCVEIVQEAVGQVGRNPGVIIHNFLQVVLSGLPKGELHRSSYLGMRARNAATSLAASVSGIEILSMPSLIRSRSRRSASFRGPEALSPGSAGFGEEGG